MHAGSLRGVDVCMHPCKRSGVNIGSLVDMYTHTAVCTHFGQGSGPGDYQDNPRIDSHSVTTHKVVNGGRTVVLALLCQHQYQCQHETSIANTCLCL